MGQLELSSRRSAAAGELSRAVIPHERARNARERVSGSRSNVREVQVLADAADFRRAERLVGRRVAISGTLTGADVGYHRRDVLIDATLPEAQIRPAR